LGKKKKKTKLHTGKPYTILAIVVFVFGMAILLNGTVILADIQGWAKGIWNDTLDYVGGMENLSGIPTVGWLSSSSGLSVCSQGATYKITLAEGTDERILKGAAWFGIGSVGDPIDDDAAGSCQSDSPSLGWLNFDQGSPAPCPNNEFCYPAKWTKTANGTGLEGTITGWAQITSMMAMPKNDGTKAQNGWVKIYGAPVNSEGIIYDNGSLSPGGVKTNYAWSSGEETTIQNNSGLGWIKLDGLKISECSLPKCSYKEICETATLSSCDVASFCSSDANPTAQCIVAPNGKDWTCKNDCGETPCPNKIITAEPGECGDVKSICDNPSQNPPDTVLCKKGTPSSITRESYEITWTCGNNACGGTVSVECSASVRCGWIETNP
jgi:hypothetical protein